MVYRWTRPGWAKLGVQVFGSILHEGSVVEQNILSFVGVDKVF